MTFRDPTECVFNRIKCICKTANITTTTRRKTLTLRVRSEKGHKGWHYNIERHKSKTTVFVLHTDLAAITLQNSMKTILLSAHAYFHTHTNTYMHAHAHTPSSLLSRSTVGLRLQQLKLPLKLT